ncbi:MAG: DUF5034 domain-containing protein [Bacteroidota bacterium]
MNYQKVLLVLLLPILANVIIGCCDCLETIFFNYTNCDISLQSLDNAGPEPLISVSNVVQKEAFGLRVTVDRREDLCQNTFAPLFISSAYAISCDCPPAQLYQPLDSIVTIEVISLTDFDPGNGNGDDITANFSILSFTEFLSIEEFLNSQFYDIYNLEDEIFSFDLMLMVPPPERGLYQFEVRLALSDGRVLSRISEEIELL